MESLSAPAKPWNLRITWVVGLFGVLVGITMACVPHEFGASPFRIIYPYIREFGLAFLCGGMAILLAEIHPGFPKSLAWLGWGFIFLALGSFWWLVSLKTGSITGILMYPFLATAIFVERVISPKKGVFIAFMATVGLCFGLAMVKWPHRVGPALQGALYLPTLHMGIAFLVAAAGLLWAVAARSESWLRRCFALYGLLFAQLAAALVKLQSWTGMELYLMLAVGCFSAAIPWKRRSHSGIRWRLMSSMASAALVPLIILGVLGCQLAHRFIEKEVRNRTEQARIGEVAWLEEMAKSAHATLAQESARPQLGQMLMSNETEELSRILEEALARQKALSALWILGPGGQRLVGAGGAHDAAGNVARDDYFRGIGSSQFPSISLPYRSATGDAYVTLAVPIYSDGNITGILAGGISLERLSQEATFTSRHFDVHVFDERDGKLLRDTSVGGQPLLPVSFASELLRGPIAGTVTAFDSDNAPILASFARVAGTPWHVLVTARLKHVYAPVTRLSAAFIALLTATGILAFVLSRIAGRDVILRLANVQNAAMALASNDLGYRAQEKGEDEITELARGFNEMAERVEATQAQLARTNGELRDAVRVRDDFLSVASHELRTPMTPIKATVQLLQIQLERGQLDDPEKIRRLFSRVVRQVDKLENLVTELLDVSRIRAGRFVLDPSPIDFGELVAEVIERFSQSLDGKRTIVRNDSGDSFVGFWDGTRLDQVLTNLIENAIRYSHDGSTITVSLEGNLEHVHLTVADQGIGVPPEELPRLFQAFSRAGNAVHKHRGGLGLGLFICREIVERHHGRLWVESQGAGQGTRMHVELPRAALRPEEAHEAGRPEDADVSHAR